jgi:hypothetical protein
MELCSIRGKRRLVHALLVVRHRLSPAPRLLCGMLQLAGTLFLSCSRLDLCHRFMPLLIGARSFELQRLPQRLLVCTFEFRTHRKHRCVGFRTLSAQCSLTRILGRLNFAGNGRNLCNALCQLCANCSAFLFAVVLNGPNRIGMLGLESCKCCGGRLELRRLLLTVRYLLV